MTSLASKLTVIVSAAFEEAGLPADLGLVRVSDRPDLAQFQCNGAMAAAKVAKKNPRAVAEEVAGRLKARGEFAKVEIAGPGFINIDLTPEAIAGHLSAMATDARLSVPEMAQGETVVLDYGGPNIAKPMHVGHLRAGIIGDTLRRIMAFAGYKTLGDVHMGDWGTHLGILFNDYIRSGEQDKVLKVDLDDPASVSALFEDMSERYPRASAASKEDEALRAQAQEATLKMQNREAPYYEMWQKVKAVSIVGMERNYGMLNVHFDLWKGEADVHDLIPPMVDDLKARGYAVESEGAIVVPVKRNEDKKEVPPLLLVKRDGAFIYGSTDLATVVERMQLYGPSKIIYVVDQRQGLHFEQVFRAARMGGIAPDAVELTFAGFGTMNGPDGKPFKTRAGGVLKLEDLIAMGVAKATERLNDANLAKDMPETERASIAHKVAVAAIKFADLQNQRQADYVFDIDRMVSFEGKTGPYLLYQAVRIKSLLRKAESSGSETRGFGNTEIQKFGDSDIPLALLLCELPDVFEGALNNYTPHLLCEYAYRLAQTFSSFYNSCHILSEEDEVLRGSRLTLCTLTLAQLELVLSLLGIEVPDRM
ncbi:MAG: arginine--tRNA ligase [Alphaproteobacteria bacterium]|nr:arginine--tRNA ligase [Alphaproteobacteria bacterium]